MQQITEIRYTELQEKSIDERIEEFKLYGNRSRKQVQEIEVEVSADIYGSASEVTSDEYLMTDNYDQAACIAYDRRLNTADGFDISFDYCATEGSGVNADGFTAMFTKEKGQLGGLGNAIGVYESDDTYAVELDSYFDGMGNDNDPFYQHVAIIQGNHTNHLTTHRCDVVADGKWHKVRISYKDKKMEVYVDNQKYLTQDEFELPADVYFSITSSTGSQFNVQKVKNVSVAQGILRWKMT